MMAASSPSVVLGPLFDQPLHRAPWCKYGVDRGKRPDCPRYDFRVTNAFDGVDLVNGGRHNAVDVGNAAQGFPVVSPAGCMVRAARHFDDARGRELDLGGGWVLALWHLAADPATDAIPRPGLGTSYGPWTRVARGARIGTTGATGANLPTGAPMPAHTHIELAYRDRRVDPQPHLFGSPIEGAMDLDDQHFDDVEPGDPFYADIQWMYEAGISSGVSGTRDYVPDGLVTRGQLAAFLHRFERHLRAGR